MSRVVFFEIPVDDLERAQSFYTEVFGWEIQAFGEDVSLVVTVRADEQQPAVGPGAINGDLYKRTEWGRHPSVVMETIDIDDQIQRIEQAGGKVRQRRTIEGLGSIAAFEDPEGNVLGIWEREDVERHV
jgi:predicted enzyme related to lactoylglutathione lyase